MLAGPEQRLHERLAIGVRITYTILASVNATPIEYGSTITENISEGGLCMLMDETIAAKRLLYVNIQIPNPNRSILLLGKTVDVQKDPQTQKNRVRVKFVGTLPTGLREILTECSDSLPASS